MPKRSQDGGSQHQVALLIREGRKAAQQLAAGMVDAGTDMTTTVPAVLEQDFTVQGRQGMLACPFSAKPNQDGGLPGDAEPVDGSQDLAGVMADPTPHKSSDPICAAMLEDPSAPSVSARSKCPIRFLDKHSPEEIANYVKTHKHEIPRSHEVCVRRYQKNEEQIRKLDAKYGSLVNMVQDLSHLHRPMMPQTRQEQQEADRVSSKKVEEWTQTVVAGEPEREPEPVPEPEPGNVPPVDEERDNRFDRQLRDVRLGESPSRPWGISVPFAAEAVQRREASPPKPVEVPLPAPHEPTPAKKCPFDHTKMGVQGAAGRGSPEAHAPIKPPAAAVKEEVAPSNTQPTFVNLSELPAAGAKGERPQVVFNISGPVFIGYPMEQAVEFMQRLQGR